jgi:hypothetical protein
MLFLHQYHLESVVFSSLAANFDSTIIAQLALMTNVTSVLDEQNVCRHMEKSNSQSSEL